MLLPVCAYIETHNSAFLADTLRLDNIRAGGGIDSNETVALMAGQEEPGHLTTGGPIYHAAVVVNPKGNRRRASAGIQGLYLIISQEEGIPVSIRADYVTSAIDSERHRRGTRVDIENHNGSEDIPKEVVESPIVVDVKSDSNSSV
jgi:hypothetical protein